MHFVSEKRGSASFNPASAKNMARFMLLLSCPDHVPVSDLLLFIHELFSAKALHLNREQNTMRVTSLAENLAPG